MSEQINFFSEDISLPDFFNEEKIRHWLIGLVNSYKKEIENINYIFCSDDYLLQINKEYLNHDYYTDIITFPYQEGNIIESDIFISLDRIKDNASTLSQDYMSELLRVIAHGILHLCGLKDKTDQEAKMMREAEEAALAKYS